LGILLTSILSSCSKQRNLFKRGILMVFYYYPVCVAMPHKCTHISQVILLYCD
jgi:hypothetical protein